MNATLKKNQTQETLEQLTLTNCQTQTYCVEDFLALLSPLLEKGLDSAKPILEAVYSLRYAESYGLKEPNILSLKTSRGCLITTMEEHLESSSLVWMNLGMTFNGNCLTAKISESRKTGKESLLSEVLERQGFFSNISPTPDANYSKGRASRQYVNEAGVAQWRRGYFREYKSDGTPTLTANMGTGGHNVPFVRAVITPDRAEKLDIRKLTPMECERLQGFPDNWTKYYADGTLVSDSERYERCGRTITVPVVQSIGERFAKNEYY